MSGRKRYGLPATIPHLTRSSLHRCLPRHNISRLADAEAAAPAKRWFKTYPLGYFHIDIGALLTTQGELYLLVAIDRVTEFAFVELHQKSHSTHCRRLPARPHNGRALNNPYGPDRQGHTLHDGWEHGLGCIRHQGRHGCRRAVPGTCLPIRPERQAVFGEHRWTP